MKHCLPLPFSSLRPSQWGKRTQQKPRRSRSELWLSHLIIGALIIAAVGRHSGISAACVRLIWKLWRRNFIVEKSRFLEQNASPRIKMPLRGPEKNTMQKIQFVELGVSQFLVFLFVQFFI
jgi:hypothetical protein